MKYALVKGIETTAFKGVKGICRICGLELIAKCGERKMNHWAHTGAQTCDSWWEPETEWHRSWKNSFPHGWQESILFDKQSGEKHIADIETSHGLVIEFQHSYLKPDERLLREKFYKNLVWVVDGTRLKQDYPRFAKKKGSFPETKNGIFSVASPEKCFPSGWLDSSAPVVFDFLGNQTTTEHNDNGLSILYCLFPLKIRGSARVATFTRTAFVNTVTNGEWSSRTKLQRKRASRPITEIPKAQQEAQKNVNRPINSPL